MAKDVVKVEKSDVSEVLPDFIKGKAGAGAGTEGLSSDAITPPRLKLIQALSPELEEVSSLKPGHYYNNVLQKDYGPIVKIIPCYLTEAYLLFAPRVPGSPGGLLARANDGVHWNPANMAFDVVIDKKGTKAVWKTANTVRQSGLSAWGTSDPLDKNSPPAATYAINCVVVVNHEVEDGPMVISFMRSAIKVGKKFAGSLRMARAPSYGRVFELSSLKVEGPSGPYFEPRLRPLGFIDDPALFADTQAIYEMARRSGVSVDVGADAAPAVNDDDDIGGEEVPF